MNKGQRVKGSEGQRGNAGSRVAPLRFPLSLRPFAPLSLVLLLAGCAGGGGQKQPATAANDPKAAAVAQQQAEGGSAKLNAWLASQPLDIPAAPYHIAPPDKLKIVAPQVKEIDGLEAIVRTDGAISLNLVGDVKVGGLTPGEVSEQVAERLRKFYGDSAIDVSVQVVEFKSRSYFVMGQVIDPGVKPYTGRDTVVKVLADAKLNNDAWPQHIVIVRPNEDPSIQQRVTVDVKEMYENGKVAQNYLIEPGDLIYVPPSPIAEIGMTFKKVIYPLVPATQIGMFMRGGI